METKELNKQETSLYQYKKYKKRKEKNEKKKEKKKKKILKPGKKIREKFSSYKMSVFRYVFLLITLLLLMFFAYTYYDYNVEREENAGREARMTANRIVSQNDERLGRLRQYYIMMAEDESIKWLLENDIRYSDYSSYKKAYDDMGSKGIFGDYVSGFTFANFKTGWILNNKGLFRLDEAYNGSTIMSIYEEKIQDAEKSYWKYDDAGVVLKSQVDRNYRITLETKGLNFVMRLPEASYNTHAVFVANISMDTWENWMREWLQPCEDIVVLDSRGALIYATDEKLVQACMDFYETGAEEGRVKQEGVDYRMAQSVSSILDWHYCVLYNVEEGQAAMRMPAVVFGMIFLLVVCCFFLVSNLIYHPIGTLVKKVSETEGKEPVVGNELEYLSGSIHNLKKDKQTLEGQLYQQRDKLEELFQLRLIHGEVREEEWEEYLAGFKLRTWKYYATVVVILNLDDEEVRSMVDEDAACLKLLAEMPDSVKDMAWMLPIYNASAIFAIFGEEDENALLERIRGFYREMQEYTRKICDYHILMGVSSTHTDYRHIRAAYRESINALTFKSGISGSAGLEVNVDGRQREDACHFYLASSTVLGDEYKRHYEEDIQMAVKAVDKKLCYEVTDAFCYYLSQAQGREGELPVYLLRYVNAILITAVEAGVNLKEIYPDGVKEIYSELLRILEPDRERRYIKWKFIDPVIQARMEFLGNHATSIIEEIEKLISDRNGNISLMECADSLGVHQTYIWKVLKMERDKSFSDYVEEYKLNEAKRLLLESNLTVAEIAERLNYANAQNFIRFFSKSTGVTPGKFRKLY